MNSSYVSYVCILALHIMNIETMKPRILFYPNTYPNHTTSVGIQYPSPKTTLPARTWKKILS